MNIRRPQSYNHLAVQVGVADGMKFDPAASLEEKAQKVALDKQLRPLRDEAWLEYEAILRDTKSFTLEWIRDWLAKRGAKCSASAVHRDRRCLLSRERVHRLANEKLKAIFEQFEGMPVGDLYRGGLKVAGQKLLGVMLNYDPDRLEEVTPGQMVNLIDVFGRLSKSQIEGDLIRAKLDELKRKFDEAVDAAAVKNKAGNGGKLTPEDIAEIRKTVFGEAA